VRAHAPPKGKNKIERWGGEREKIFLDFGSAQAAAKQGQLDKAMIS